MKKISRYLILVTLVATTCSCAKDIAAIKNNREAGDYLLNQQKVGVAGYPAQRLHVYKMKSVDVESPPSGADQKAVQTYMKEKGLDSLIVVETSRVDQAAKTDPSGVLKAAEFGTRLATAAIGGIASPGSSSSTSVSYAPTVAVTFKVTAYDKNGAILDDRITTEQIAKDSKQTDEELAGVVIYRMFDLGRASGLVPTK